MAAPTIKYAVYPGTTTLYNGTEVTYTASELAALYQVDDEDYLEVADAASEASLVANGTYHEYIHLKVRRDGLYYDAKDAEHTQDDGLDGEDFDGSRRYTQETKRPFDDLKD